MKRALFIVFFFLCLRNFASHIVGGEIFYDYLGNDKYRISLKIYRDCINGQANFDGLPSGSTIVPALISVRAANGTPIGVYDIGVPVVTNIPPTINSPCIQTPSNVCVQEGLYTYTLELTPLAGGYYVVYQRCCRNGSIVNLLSSGFQGSTYYTKIPGPEVAVTNSSPRFKNFPPIFLCNDVNFNFNHLATDPDGDVLVYSLCPPFLGVDGCCTFIGSGTPVASIGCSNPPPACPNIALAPPYSLVNYVAPYNGSYPIASNPAVSIDPNTGLLSGTPNLIGQFVVGVCVQEFRNNVLIDTHFRDFQFNIVSCVVSVISAVADQDQPCMGNTISFVNQSSSNIGNISYLWNFGVPGTLADTSRLVNPTFTYQDTGKYTVTLIANPGKPCSDTVQKQVSVYPPLDIRFVPPGRQCLKNNSFNFKAAGVFDVLATFEWDFSSSASPRFSTLKEPGGITYFNSGTYPVKLLAEQFGCRDSTVDSIRVLRRPQARIREFPLKLCDPAVVEFGNDSESDLPLAYHWSFSNGATSQDFETRQVFSPAGNYKVTLLVTTQGLCTDTSVYSVNNVTVDPSPVADFISSPEVTSIFDPEVSFTSKSSFDAVSWHYNFGDGTASVFPLERHAYKDYGDFQVWLSVGNKYGCFDSTSRIVRILAEFRFWIPNTFTPDDNAVNDVFAPSLIGVTDYEFLIYDRWGQKLFHTNDVEKGWNGTFKGKACEQDVYAWKISFRNLATAEKEVRVGHVLILRNL